MKNPAAWLALAVLAIASAIMVFFVMPQINGSKGHTDGVATTAPDAATQGADNQDAAKTVVDQAKQVANGAQDAAGKAARVASSSEILKKMDRLKAEASDASQRLQAMFANGNIPTDAALADTKRKLETALKSIAEFKAPDGADSTISGVVAGLSASASKALDNLKSMPANASDAASTASQIAALFGSGTKKQDPAVADANAPAPANAPDSAAEKLPAFDILRVEKDGSTVIAGRAVPGSEVAVMDGDQAIGSAKAGDGGDFVVVLDKPLSVGDHTLVLKAIMANKKSLQSEEVATVSVPADKAGELLAMVSKPGEVSRILTKPEEEEVAANMPSATPQKSEAQKTKADPSATAPQPGAEQSVEIRIDAVELEGDKMFVAGTSKPNTQIQVYADDKLLDSAVSAADGHFVAEGNMPLVTGNHIVRADVMDSTGSKVVLRASVPFNRPEGDVSVVADTTAPAPIHGSNQSSVIGTSQLEQMREEAAKALVLLKGVFADGKPPAKDQLAAAKSACVIAFKALAGFKPAPDAGEKIVAASASAAKSASDALKLLDAAGDDASGIGAAIASIEAAAAGAMPVGVTPMGKATVTKPAEEMAEGSNSSAATDGKTPAATSEAGPKTVEQAPMKESNSTVIIRKGDTLWQISRRVYGRGIRYTTIYLANQDQINNPNLIEPGQVFGVPDKPIQSDAEAEATSRKYEPKR